MPFMNKNKFENHLACFRNDQCRSGFCRKGRCSDPLKTNDPCLPVLENCPKSSKLELMHCSVFSHTCVPFNYTKSIPCRSQSDCRPTEFCIKGTCTPSLSIGSACDIVKAKNFCAQGSKCTSSTSEPNQTKCHELCNEAVPCSSGFSCKSSICVRNQSNHLINFDDLYDEEVIVGLVIILAFLIILLAGIYGWIRLTRSGKDPRLDMTKSKQKKKKNKRKLRLNYDGNGLATVTLIPSNCHSPQPISASQLFNQSPESFIQLGTDPPPYCEVVNIQ